jgi:FtsZ-binding cell division protein ZapB
VNARLFQALESRALKLQEMVEQKETGAASDAARTGDLEHRVDAVAGSLERLAATANPEWKENLQALAGEVEAVRRALREPPNDGDPPSS